MVKVREWEQDKYIEITTVRIMMVVLYRWSEVKEPCKYMLICKYIIIVTHTCMYSLALQLLQQSNKEDIVCSSWKMREGVASFVLRKQ